jgi:hypothetical protein
LASVDKSTKSVGAAYIARFPTLPAIRCRRRRGNSCLLEICACWSSYFTGSEICKPFAGYDQENLGKCPSLMCFFDVMSRKLTVFLPDDLRRIVDSPLAIAGERAPGETLPIKQSRAFLIGNVVIAYFPASS